MSVGESLANLSLYRKHRPQTFEEVVGQEHITTTLVNAISHDSLGHAYLFTGPRGTGKTSTARILSKAVNCEKGPTATPCNTCDQCVGITRGASVDVIEIDAASHGGVDDVRDLRDRVAFSPAAARKKVYIVDECHMLSVAGWNAFLKTLEEPPDHVLFVFATTEPHKVLPTILSRTQRFDFRRIGAAALTTYCERIAEVEGISFEPGALDLVVRAGDGSARDTLSVLDQVLAFTGSTVTLRGVAEVLGATDDELLGQTVDLVGAGDVPGLCVLVGRLADAGTDLRQFARDAVEHFRRLLLLQAAPDADLVDGTPEQLAAWQAQAGGLGRTELLRTVELLADAQADMRRGNTRLPLEIALVKAALPEASGDPGALAARLDRLERRAGVEPPAEAAAPAQRVGSGDDARADVGSGEDARADVGSGQDARADVGSGEDARADVGSGEEAPVEAGDGPRNADIPADAAGSPTADSGPPAAQEPRSAHEAPVADKGLRDQPADSARPEPPETPSGGTAPVDLELVQRSWPAVLEATKSASRRLHAFLAPGRPTALEGGELTILFGATNGFHAEQCQSDEWRGTVVQALRTVLGADLRLRCVVATTDDSQTGKAAAEEATGEAVEVLETEAAEAAGERPDENEVHARAVERLTRDLGAEVVDD